MSNNSLPNTVDIEINGVCNLDCAWCWGPVHTPEIETVSNAQWYAVVSDLYDHGTRSIVVTGGEPLLRKGIGDVIEFIKDKGMRVTLSTNGILLKSLIPLLPYIDDIGLPLDGADHESNSKMRVANNSKLKHIDLVLQTIKYVQDSNPEVRLTVRTVVSARNHDQVAAIGATLLKTGIDPTKMRWKLYQVSPEGPRHDTTVNDGWLIDAKLFQEVAAQVRSQNPSFSSISFMAVEKSIKRYLLIDPSGDAFVLGPDQNGNPMQIMVGNTVRNFEMLVRNLDKHQYFPSDPTHGV